MKKFNYLFVFAILFTLISCSGSDTYRGDWKAVDESGNKYEISFDANKFTFTPEGGESKEYEYTQNSVSIENGIETYGIKLDDGRSFDIHFPIADDESKGVIKDGNGKLIYLIGRDDYVEYEEIYDL